MDNIVTGYWDVTVTTACPAWSSTGTLSNGLLIKCSGTITRYIDDNVDTTITLRLESGDVIVFVPAHTFGESLWLTVASAKVPCADRPEIKECSLGLEITNDKNLQPKKNITITVNYRDSDVAGLEPSKLSLPWYDTEHSRWMPIPAAVYASQNKIVVNVVHLSMFVLAQMAPASDLSTVKVFPNPFNPTAGKLTIDNLTADAQIKIFDIAGELVSDVDYTAGDGRTTWDGKNTGGRTVASGVYLALIKNSDGKKIVKIAVEK
jgi:hypothetical protein